MIKVSDSQIDIIVARRFKKANERCGLKNYIKPSRQVMKEVLIESLKNSFKCEYCKREMRLNDYDSIKYFTYDHIIPLSHKGTQEKDNLILCCIGCNLLKQNYSYELTMELHKYLPISIIDRLSYQVKRTIEEYKINEIKLRKIIMSQSKLINGR